MPSDFRFFTWNDTVNGRVQDVPSHEAVRQLIERDGEDYRSEDAESPIPELRSRKKDDTKLARVPVSYTHLDVYKRQPPARSA